VTWLPGDAAGLHGEHCCERHDQCRHGDGEGGGETVAPHHLAQLIEGARRPGEDRLIGEVALEIGG
jgi:hypothetical protein